MWLVIRSGQPSRLLNGKRGPLARVDKMARSKKRLNEIKKAVKELGMEMAAVSLGIKDIERAMREVKAVNKPKPKPVDDRPVLVMPDLHAPYHHPQAIDFLKWVHESRGCRPRVASVGDMHDFHSMSFHKNEPDSLSPEEEYRMIREFSAELTSVFPEGDMVLGNHGNLPTRRLVDAGLAPSMLQSPNELYNMPDTWTIHPMYFVLEPDRWDVLVEHGEGSGGKYGCANTAKEKRCSYVQGHTHSNAAVIYSTNHVGTIFGMNVGCLVDSASLAMRYGRYATRKGVLSCGVVYNGSHAEVVTMESWPEFKK